MTDDQIRDLVMVSIFIIVTIIVFGGMFIRLYRYYKCQGLGRFDQFLDSLENDYSEYKFFTTGHSEVWCETTEEEARRHIVNQCLRVMGAPLPIPSPSNYLLHVNEGRKAVYVVFGDRRNFTFDWNSLVHYEDYVHENKQYTIKVS